MINPINVPGPEKHGGKWGLLGKIGGGLLAAIGSAAAPFTGGASSALVPIGIAGATAGGLLDPGSIKQYGKGPTLLESALHLDPGLQLSVLEDGQKAVQEYPGFSLPQRKALISHLETAKGPLRERMNLVNTSQS